MRVVHHIAGLQNCREVEAMELNSQTVDEQESVEVDAKVPSLSPLKRTIIE